MRARLGTQREQLAALVRASYQLGGDAPLKVLLAQDSVADANRALAYHRYVQRDRAQKITALTTELQALDDVERDIAARRVQLDAARQQQRAQVSTLEKDRKARAALTADLDQRYKDRSTREKALGQDARALERLLANLRAAAARAEAERKAAAKRAAANKPPPHARQRPRRARPATRHVTCASRRHAAASRGRHCAGVEGRRPGLAAVRQPAGALRRHACRMAARSSGVLIGAPAGSTVTAVADGSVVFSEWMTGYGLILIVDHGNGYMSLYAHNDTPAARCRRPGEARRRAGQGRHLRRAGHARRCISNCAATASRWIRPRGCSGSSACNGIATRFGGHDGATRAATCLRHGRSRLTVNRLSRILR